MESLERILLFDYYGDLLTERQKICFDMHYNQDLSLSEIAQELSISRQAVHDTLTRTEQLLKNMEAKTGCVRRDQACRAAAETILTAARQLRNHSDTAVSRLAGEIIAAARGLEE